MHDKYRYKFNASALIDHFGGATMTTKILNDMGAEIKVKAVQKMRERNVMQGDAIATLMMAAMTAGQPINPYAYILERDNDEKCAEVA